MILRRLQQATLESRFVGTFDDKHRPTVFAAGRARVCNEEITILSSVTKDGFEDGLAVRATLNIFKLEEETKYLQSLNELWHYHGAKKSDIEDVVVIESIHSFQQLFEELQRVKTIVSLWIEGDLINEVCGTVAEIQNGFFRLDLIAASGESNGSVTLRVEDVQSVNAGGFDERRIGIARELYLRRERDERG